MKTKAAVLVQCKQPLELLDLDIPPLEPGQVLVKLSYSGLCRSQINEWNGTKGEDPFLPHTLGHEGSGVVLECGKEVTKVKPDDHVVISWIKGQGKDIPSTRYKSKIGMVNSGAISTFLEIAVISENRLVTIPKTMPLKEAALLGCAIPTGAGIIFNEMGVQEGKSVAVFGVGGVGMSALLAASFVKANPIIAIDVLEEKLDRAIKLGATHTIDASKENVQEKIREIVKDNGVDYSVESSGRKDVMEMAFTSVKDLGGHCVLAGNLPKGETIQIDPFDLIKGKKIRGTWGGNAAIDKDIHFYVEMFSKKPKNFEQLISHEVPLEEINPLMNAFESGHVARGLICFN